MKLTKEQLAMLETPCVILDVAQARRNIEAMQAAADAAGCALRPHIKTHKMAVFARMQVEAGAQGITCAKVSEAETMAAGGLRDIFIAYPMVGAFRIRRALALAPKLDRLILAVAMLLGLSGLASALLQPVAGARAGRMRRSRARPEPMGALSAARWIWTCPR